MAHFQTHIWCGLLYFVLYSVLHSRLEVSHYSNSKMKFENVLAEVNGFGRFQLGMIIMMVIPRVTLPFHFLLNNFIAVVPSHHCNISSLDDGGLFRNLSQEERLVVSIPFQEDGTPSSCHMFREPQYHLLLNSSNITDPATVPCQNGWVYDNTTFKSTLATEVSIIFGVYKALKKIPFQTRYFILSSFDLLSVFPQ